MKNFREIKIYDVIPGSNISNIITEAIDNASWHNCIIKFNFNGVEIRITETSCLKDIISFYYNRIENKRKR